jgi:hypothetical protein
MRKLRFVSAVVLGGAMFFGLGGGSSPVRAADHGDAPNVSSDQGADIADVYAFLDPNDNDLVTLAMTFRGFISPAEAVNFTNFDPNVLYRFEIENTGDAKPDLFIDVTFSPRTAADKPQIATIKLPGGKKNTFTAPTTVSNESATPPDSVVTSTHGHFSFFAGEVDDPFFFDIPAFSRFIASVQAGSPDASVFSRGRDSFAGYNVLSIVLSVPKSLLAGKKNNVIGVDGVTMRKTQSFVSDGTVKRAGNYRQVDRMGNPAVNVALIPFARKNEYNARNTRDDAKGRFAKDIVASLKSLGTDDAHISALANVAVLKGDFLRLDLTVPNSGFAGGTNAGAGFPNGRRPSDDVIDTILTIVANGNTLGDSVDGNDVPYRNKFPFLAEPHQPLASGVVDDNTRN